MTFSPILLDSGVAGYNFLNRTREQQQGLYDQSPVVARDIAQFKAGLEGIETAQDLMDNRGMLRVALGAFGLDEDINNRAFIQRVLESDLDDSTSLANRLSDKRYQSLAEAFNFAGGGPVAEPEPEPTDEVGRKLAALTSADDLLSDRNLLRAALTTFGLEDNVGEVFFLKQVLESDVTDETSFANELSDPRFAELAAAFDFAPKSGPADALVEFAELFEGRFAELQTAEDLVSDTALFEGALKIFNLENEVYRPDFMEEILSSDLDDPASLANQQGDPRYVALTEAFGFSLATPPLLGTNAERFVDVVLSNAGDIKEPVDLFSDFKLLIATTNFFDMPLGSSATRYAQRLLEADKSDPQSLVNLVKDERYLPFVKAFDFQPVAEAPTYPPGFAEKLTANYSERQFEIEVGNSDSSMRVALALERELGTVIETGTTEDSRWFGIMASPALRSVFETTFGLPSSFGTLDIDQQLSELKTRSERQFGTTDVADFNTPEQLDSLRQTYLLQQNSVQSFGSGSSSDGLALALLSGFQF